MKKIFTVILFTLCFVGLSKAQQTQSVSYNSTKTYTANPDTGTSVDHYQWQLVDMSDVTVKDLSAETGATVSISWDLTIGETYRLRSQVYDTENCSSEFVYVDVTIVGDASVLFADVSANESVVTCSLLSGEDATSYDFDITISGGVAPFVINYISTDKYGVEIVGSKTFGATGDTTPLTGTFSISDFENVTGASQTVSIEITGGTTADGSTIAIDSDESDNIRSVTVYSKPVITNLTLN
ncbi:hypothetical protein [Labilibaculum sp.]|uniref:hypothetical protein n=1 Tax=Labilibaculum sp. TaxID=2060723 RepID=UPI00356785E5